VATINVPTRAEILLNAYQSALTASETAIREYAAAFGDDPVSPELRRLLDLRRIALSDFFAADQGVLMERILARQISPNSET
jgi:hypothetical protein